MRYPCLIDKRYCTTPAHIVIEGEGLDENGGPVKAFEADLFCNWQDTAKTVLTAEQKLVQLEASALFPGDIAPGESVISSGTITINGTQRRIYRGMKARNPDGTVNYTRLDIT